MSADGLVMFTVYYSGRDGKNGCEYWGEVYARDAQHALECARAIEPIDIEGQPMRFVAANEVRQ